MNRWIFLLIGCGQALLVRGQNSLRPNLFAQPQALHYYNVAAGAPDSSAKSSVMLYGTHKFVDNDAWTKPLTVFASYIQQMQGHRGFYSAGYLNDSYSFFNRQTFYAGYTRQVKIFGTRTLSLGLRTVLNLDRVRWNDWQPPSRNGTDTRLTPDLDLGVSYQGRKLAVGLSAKNLLGYSVRFDGEKLLINQREYYLWLARTFQLSKRITIMPYTLVRLERGIDADLGLSLGLFQRVSVGYQFRIWELRNIFSLAINPGKRLRLGITYDQSLVHRDNNADLFIAYIF